MTLAQARLYLGASAQLEQDEQRRMAIAMRIAFGADQEQWERFIQI